MAKLFEVDQIIKTKQNIFVDILKDGDVKEIKLSRMDFEKWLDRSGQVENGYWESNAPYGDLYDYLVIMKGDEIFSATLESITSICKEYAN